VQAAYLAYYRVVKHNVIIVSHNSSARTLEYNV
jgi:hypothetical protein